MGNLHDVSLCSFIQIAVAFTQWSAPPDIQKANQERPSTECLTEGNKEIVLITRCRWISDSRLRTHMQTVRAQKYTSDRQSVLSKVLDGNVNEAHIIAHQQTTTARCSKRANALNPAISAHKAGREKQELHKGDSNTSRRKSQIKKKAKTNQVHGIVETNRSVHFIKVHYRWSVPSAGALRRADACSIDICLLPMERPGCIVCKRGQRTETAF